ncbi:MAG: LTA synthase family protein [gamma proteobacterium symbiont of Bathyaustriella thionipta]|nr:LTA synthase family protein [gamma proteobacterium symbiont of Bathyaustriella thionipta]
MSILRLLLALRNAELLQDIPLIDIARALLIGIRFDLIIVSYIFLPLAFALLLPDGLGKRKLVSIYLLFLLGVSFFAGVVELDFYHEFHNRLNGIAVQYLKEDPATVISMLWNGFPVITYLILWMLLLTAYGSGLWFFAKKTSVPSKNTQALWLRISLALPVFLLLVIGARGATIRSGPPLRWGDAFQSDYLFANHLALNSTYTLLKAIQENFKEKKSDVWLHAMPLQEALNNSRKMLLSGRETLLNPDRNFLLRHYQPAESEPRKPYSNVVVILMESFSAQYVGALGNGDHITPQFDRLAKEGLLFERFFSNGTHTHQGMFATFSCFPNLPGFEYLMQQSQGRNKFSGLPALLTERNYANVYVYNGDFSWDNQKGFFRNQGMTHFVGRHDYSKPKFQDRTWGVSDEDMFNRALQELDKLESGQPFFAMLQTLSNHTPYALPEKLPFQPITTMGEISQHLTAMKYSDWALGEFFKSVKNRPYYDHTLFVILGDHGIAVKPQVSDMDLLRFHVPLLLIAPGIQQQYGSRISTVATQVDVAPTVMALLGKPFTHQCWGRDVLSLPPSDKGFGVIKPSGGEQILALLKDDVILVRRAHRKPRLGRYRLQPQPAYLPLDHAGQKRQMNKELSSYVETALQALYENKTGHKDSAKR